MSKTQIQRKYPELNQLETCLQQGNKQRIMDYWVYFYELTEKQIRTGNEQNGSSEHQSSKTYKKVIKIILAFLGTNAKNQVPACFHRPDYLSKILMNGDSYNLEGSSFQTKNKKSSNIEQSDTSLRKSLSGCFELIMRIVKSNNRILEEKVIKKYILTSFLSMIKCSSSMQSLKSSKATGSTISSFSADLVSNKIGKIIRQFCRETLLFLSKLYPGTAYEPSIYVRMIVKQAITCSKFVYYPSKIKQVQSIDERDRQNSFRSNKSSTYKKELSISGKKLNDLGSSEGSKTTKSNLQTSKVKQEFDKQRHYSASQYLSPKLTSLKNKHSGFDFQRNSSRYFFQSKSDITEQNYRDQIEKNKKQQNKLKIHINSFEQKSNNERSNPQNQSEQDVKSSRKSFKTNKIESSFHSRNQMSHGTLSQIIQSKTKDRFKNSYGNLNINPQISEMPLISQQSNNQNSHQIVEEQSSQIRKNLRNVQKCLQNEHENKQFNFLLQNSLYLQMNTLSKTIFRYNCIKLREKQFQTEKQRYKMIVQHKSNQICEISIYCDNPVKVIHPLSKYLKLFYQTEENEKKAILQVQYKCLLEQNNSLDIIIQIQGQKILLPFSIIDLLIPTPNPPPLPLCCLASTKIRLDKQITPTPKDLLSLLSPSSSPLSSPSSSSSSLSSPSLLAFTFLSSPLWMEMLGEGNGYVLLRVFGRDGGEGAQGGEQGKEGDMGDIGVLVREVKEVLQVGGRLRKVKANF